MYVSAIYNMDTMEPTEPTRISLSNEEIIILTENFAKDYMKKYDDSHSFEHAMRVKNIATILAISENLNEEQIFIIQLAALTHDINDSKYSNNNEDTQENVLRGFFNNLIDDKSILENIIEIACNVSLSLELAKPSSSPKSIELDCVRDADRIDSLGAIGISRYFTYGIVNKQSNISSIIDNIENRTNILMNNINTDMGKKISTDKYRIIRMFIEDYRDTMFYQSL
jgi:HD superfamily phosphodiesterase